MTIKKVKSVKAAKSDDKVKKVKKVKGAVASVKKVGKLKKAKASSAVELNDLQDTTSTGLVKGGTSINVNAAYALAGQDMAKVQALDLAEYTEGALFEYGSYVVEERAVPDFRDGLKPVHRSLLWSMNDLSLRPSGPHKKAARTVGQTIGMYHPHGDAAAYGAMVTIANTVPPLVDGQGNWGTPVDGAAAPRYTEAKMSKFTHLFMLDSEYLDVVPKIANYSNDATIPLYMPALLPYLLFNGSVPAPAYGVKAGNPTFQFESVVKVVSDMLNGEEYDAKRLAKTLIIEHEYGCKDVTPNSEMLNFMQTGQGKVTYEPRMEIEEAARIVHVTSFVPGGFASSVTINKVLEKIGQIDGVSSAYSNAGKKNYRAGPWGPAYEVKCGRVSEDRLYEIAQQVQSETTKSVTYRLGVTIRHDGARNEFKYLNFETYFKAWITYRIKLETRLNKRRIEKAEREKHIQEVFLFAVDNIKQLLAALPKVLSSEDPDKALARALKMPQEDAKIILDRQVRKLAKLERSELVAKIKKLQADLKQYQWNVKNPGKAAAKDTEQRVAKYLASPDMHIYAEKPHDIFCYRKGYLTAPKAARKTRRKK